MMKWASISWRMTLTLHSDHARLFERNRFVYPVLSRRSGGISIGVNLNPDKVCNFDCIYCQVDRRSQSETRFVETDALLAELRATLELVASGAIYETEKFRDVPPHLRRLNDIAFSGDGEPTTYKNFDELIGACADGEARGRARRREDGADHQRQHVPPAARPARAGDPRPRTTARFGPSSKRGPTSTITSSSGRRFRFGRFWTTSRPRRGCGRW